MTTQEIRVNRQLWDSMRHILCVRLDSMGDVLMTSVAIRALKESQPRRRITLLTSPSGALGARLIREIDDTIVFEAPWIKSTSNREDSLDSHRLIKQLRDTQFDGAVIFTVFSQNPLPAASYCYLADIPQRIAYCRENPYQLLTECIPEQEPEQFVRHEVQRQIDLVACIGSFAENERLSVHVPDDDRQRVHRLLEEAKLDRNDRWVVIHSGASAPSRRYPAEHFAEVVRLLVVDGFRVVMTGSADERPLIDSIRQKASVPVCSLAGRLSIGELAALLQQAPLLISNNTGPVHIAAGVGTPVVNLYALTNPQHIAWHVPHRVMFRDVPCRWCFRSICPQGHHDCLQRLQPTEVVSAALELLTESRGTIHYTGLRNN